MPGFLWVLLALACAGSLAFGIKRGINLASTKDSAGSRWTATVLSVMMPLFLVASTLVTALYAIRGPRLMALVTIILASGTLFFQRRVAALRRSGGEK